MKLKHLQALTSPQKVDENYGNSEGKSYEDSGDFESAHSKISALLRQVSMLIKSQQHANWITDTAANFSNGDEEMSGEEIYNELIEHINGAIKSNNQLYQWMIDVVG